MIPLEKKTKGKAPVGTISECKDGRTFQEFRRRKWGELTPELRSRYMNDFEESDGCNEAYKLGILATALDKKKRCMEEQVVRAEKKERKK